MPIPSAATASPGRSNFAAAPSGSGWPPERRRGQAGRGRADRETDRAARRHRLAAGRPARRKSCLRHDGHRSGDLPPTATAAGTWRKTSRPTCWPAIRTPIGSATRASGISMPRRKKTACRPARRFLPDRCWQNGRRPRRSTRSGSWPPRCSSCSPALRRQAKDSPDGLLYRQLTSIAGPLSLGTSSAAGDVNADSAEAEPAEPGAAEWGPDPALFGKHPDGTAIDAGSLCLQAPAQSRNSPACRAGRRLRVGGHRRARPAHRPPRGACSCNRRGQVGRAHGAGSEHRHGDPGRWSLDRRQSPGGLRCADSGQPGERGANDWKPPATISGNCFRRPCATPRSCRPTKSSRSTCFIAKTISWSV